jgi:hypothetical protein
MHPRLTQVVPQELVGRLVCNHHFKKCQLADLKLITMSFYGDHCTGQNRLTQ